MRKLVLILALTTVALALPGAAPASQGDPVHANDVIGLEGWRRIRTVSLRTCAATAWSASCPRSSARRSTSSAWADTLRVLTVSDTNVNSGTRPLIESRTAWVPAEQFCGDSSLRTWNRVAFDVRWSDDCLTKGLTLLSDPTEDYSTVTCPTLSTPLEQRQAVRDQLLG